MNQVKNYSIPDYKDNLTWAARPVKLVIELDGGIHGSPEQKEYDEGRTFKLEEKGFRILRFRNEEVINNIGDVIYRIKSQI